MLNLSNQTHQSVTQSSIIQVDPSRPLYFLEQPIEKRVTDDFLDELLKVRSFNETKQVYSNWANTYEKDIADMEYNGGQIAAKCFLEMNYQKDVPILDIGAGTGIVGEILAENGYTNVDALDGNEDMLAILREKKSYRNVIHSMVSPDIRLPVKDRQYEVVILAGVFCPGHIQVRSLEQILRVVKSGGIICWSMGDPKTYADRDEQYRDGNFDRYISTLCDKCKWISVLGYPRVVQNYLHGQPGQFYAMQVI